MTQSKIRGYPSQFWVLVACLTLNRMAASLIWPYITLFIQEQTGATLAQVTTLLPIQSVATIIGISGMSILLDRYGRKRLMLIGMFAFAVLMFFMSIADTLLFWAFLVGFYGILQPLFMVGANAMVADMIHEDKRTGAYAITRMMSNLSIALGPAIGGQFIVQSPLFAYYGVAVINLLLLIPVALFLTETLPKRIGEQKPQGLTMGYGEVLRDRPFFRFIICLTLVEIGIALVFSLLSVYTKTYYGILEDQFGWLLTINAGMVVLFQFGVTRLVARFQPLRVIMVASGIYVIALIMFGLSNTLAGFAVSMAVLTIGELLLTPTATAVVAGLAPVHMRARYMGLYTLTYSAGAGVGPAMGGVLADRIAPQAIWYGGAVGAAAGMIGFFLLGRMREFRQIPKQHDPRATQPVAAVIAQEGT